MQLLAKFEKILYMGFRATLNFRKFKVALDPMYRIFSNFAKSCVIKSGNNDLSKSTSWKVLETVLSHLNRKLMRKFFLSEA